VRKILPAFKRVHAKLVALVQARTVQISTNVRQTLTTALLILLVQTLSLVSLANQSADIRALPEFLNKVSHIVETQLTAKGTDAHSRTSTNVRTTLTTVPRLRMGIMSCV
jgi:hypothetical protein